jgi:hypothetical protein
MERARRTHRRGIASTVYSRIGGKKETPAGITPPANRQEV